MVQAQRYDGVTTIFALSKVKNIYPLFNFDKFIANATNQWYMIGTIKAEVELNIGVL